MAKLIYFEVLEELYEDLEDPRSDKIYSSGNRGVKKGPGPRGSRDEEFLVPSLTGALSLTFFFSCMKIMLFSEIKPW